MSGLESRNQSEWSFDKEWSCVQRNHFFPLSHVVTISVKTPYRVRDSKQFSLVLFLLFIRFDCDWKYYYRQSNWLPAIFKQSLSVIDLIRLLDLGDKFLHFVTCIACRNSGRSSRDMIYHATKIIGSLQAEESQWRIEFSTKTRETKELNYSVCSVFR